MDENSHKIKLKIITPHGIFFEDWVDIVTVKTTEGYIGIQRNHEPVMASLAIAPLNIDHLRSKNFNECAIAGGLMYSQKEIVTIITDAIEFKKNIDIIRAEKQRKILEEKLKTQKNKVEEKKMQLSLQRVVNRINVKNGPK